MERPCHHPQHNMPISITPFSLIETRLHNLTQDPKTKTMPKMFQPSIHNILPILAIITPGLSHNEHELFNLSYPRLRERTSVVSSLVVFVFLFGAREPSRVLDRLTFFFSIIS